MKTTRLLNKTTVDKFKQAKETSPKIKEPTGNQITEGGGPTM
jgi:hypothetical protein